MTSMGRLLCAAAALALVAGACSDDEDSGGAGGKGGTGGKAGSGGKSGSGGSSVGGVGGSTGGSGGSTGGSGGSTGGTGGVGASGGTGGTGGSAGQTPVERGEYLVKHVAACGDCHTPRNPDGSLDMTKWLQGVPNFADIDPADTAVGAVHSKNITPHAATGIGNWTDAELKEAFLNGVSKGGSPLFPIMPYYVLHNMSAADADAIVAYLRSIPALDNAIPARQPLGFPFTAPASAVPATAIPNTTLPASDPNYQAAVRGKYLAGNIGVCMECHTEESAPGTPVPINVAKLFYGNRPFPAAAFGLPVPPFPATILSRNLTPHANGIQGWTATAVRNALKDGVDKDGVPLCPPMPVGPMGAFGGLTDQDALDIGHYLTTLAPADNGVIENCTPPGAPPDGGSDGAAGGGDGSAGGSADSSTD
jgi:mono/diheme cytochrome c family protein